MIVWLGRYGSQPWSELERLPTRVLDRRARALGFLLEEEAPPPSATGKT